MSTRGRASARKASRAGKTKRPSSKQVAIMAARLAIDEFTRSPAIQNNLRVEVSEAVRTALERFGIDVNNPEEQRRDMVHLRTWRELMDFISKQAAGSAVKWVVAALLAAVAVGAGVLFAHKF